MLLTLADPTAVAIGNEPVRQGEHVVGWVTSAAMVTQLRKASPIRICRWNSASPATTLDVEILGERIPATVVREPLWDPKNERIKS